MNGMIYTGNWKLVNGKKVKDGFGKLASTIII